MNCHTKNCQSKSSLTDCMKKALWMRMNESCRWPKVELSLRYGILLVFLHFSLIPALVAHEEDSLDVVLELPDSGYLSISPEHIVTACSKAITKNPAINQERALQLHLTRARAYLALRKFEAAIEDCDIVIKASPKNANARYLRAEGLMARGLEKEAIAECERAVQFDPKSSLAYTFLAVNAYSHRHADKCIEYASKAIDSDPDYGPAHSIRARAFIIQNEYKRALEDLDAAERLEPLLFKEKQERLYLLRGRALLGLRNHKSAIANYQMALMIDSDNTVAISGLWEAYAYQGRFHLCDCLADRLLKKEKTAYAWVLKAMAQNELKHFDLSLKCSQAALESDSDNPHALAQQAIAYIGKGKYDMALRQIDKAIQRDTDSDNSLVCLSVKAYLLSTCPEASLRDGQAARKMAIRTCEETGFEYPKYLLILAQACAECGDYKGAVKYAKKTRLALRKDEVSPSELEESLRNFLRGAPFRHSPQPSSNDKKHEKKKGRD